MRTQLSFFCLALALAACNQTQPAVTQGADGLFYVAWQLDDEDIVGAPAPVPTRSEAGRKKVLF